MLSGGATLWLGVQSTFISQWDFLVGSWSLVSKRLGQQQKNDAMVILLTCGAVDILWACWEGAGTGPQFYFCQHPVEGHHHQSLYVDCVGSYTTKIERSIHFNFQRGRTERKTQLHPSNFDGDLLWQGLFFGTPTGIPQSLSDLSASLSDVQ